MTRKLEDFFNLPQTESNNEEDEYLPPQKTKSELMAEATEIYSSLSTADKVDHALPTVIGLESHDTEMDSIAAKAIRTFEDLLALGNNVPDMHAGKIYEVAGQMLKTALDAKNAKAEKKLRMIELQLKKIRVEQIDSELGVGPRAGNTNNEFDRAELIKYIVSNKSEKSDK